MDNDIQELADGTLRAADLVKRLNQAVRNEEDETLSVRIRPVALRAIESARPRWKDEPESRGIAVAIVTDIGDVPPIRTTASGLHDIFVNLLFNAVDELPDGGTIHIGAKLLVEVVELTVRDDGGDSRSGVRAFLLNQSDRWHRPRVTYRVRYGDTLGRQV